MTECYIECANGTPVKCADCEWAGAAEQADMISDIEQRLDAGGEVPAGQCPECGALAYIVRKRADPRVGAYVALYDIGKTSRPEEEYYGFFATIEDAEKMWLDAFRGTRARLIGIAEIVKRP